MAFCLGLERLLKNSQSPENPDFWRTLKFLSVVATSFINIKQTLHQVPIGTFVRAKQEQNAHVFNTTARRVK